MLNSHVTHVVVMVNSHVTHVVVVVNSHGTPVVVMVNSLGVSFRMNLSSFYGYYLWYNTTGAEITG